MLVHDRHRMGAYFGPGPVHVLGDGGDRGVYLFFALSGLLICTRLLREEAESGTISRKGFYLRRLFRIQPASLVYLAVLSILTLIALIPPYWDGIVSSVLMFRNFWPAPHGYEYWFSAHFWSLSVEEHFYLLLPTFLVLVRRRRMEILATTVVVLEAWRIFVFHHKQLQLFTTFIWFRTDLIISGILLGSVAALALDRPHLRSLAQRFLHPWVALLYATAIFWRLWVHHSNVDHALMVSVYPLLIVSTLLHPRSLLGRLLETPPMRFVGHISYSLYLWQQLFFVEPFGYDPSSWRSHWWLTWGGSVACAIASYYLIEQPLIRVGHRVAMRYTHAPSEAQRPEPAV